MKTDLWFVRMKANVIFGHKKCWTPLAYTLN